MDNNYKPTVLIVDDEKGLRLGAKRLLTGEGYEVTTAENGTEGIKLGTSQEFDLAIIDLKMPDVDGLEVLKRIREKYPNTVCFIATAYASYETAIESTKIGAQSYIPKPFTPEELLQHLKEGFSKRLILLRSRKVAEGTRRKTPRSSFEKTRLNTIINSMTDGVLVVNKEGLAVLFNPAALHFLELDKIIVEEYILDKLHPEILELINKFLKSCII
jgi:two-component system, OmpR family, phosphate regulon sensor histidine kinase PhoR